MAMLERNYDVGGGDLVSSWPMCPPSWRKNTGPDQRDILPIVDGSFLEKHDEENIDAVQIRRHGQHHLRPDVPLWAGAGVSISAMRDFMAIFDLTPPP